MWGYWFQCYEMLWNHFRFHHFINHVMFMDKNLEKLLGIFAVYIHHSRFPSDNHYSVGRFFGNLFGCSVLVRCFLFMVSSIGWLVGCDECPRRGGGCYFPNGITKRLS